MAIVALRHTVCSSLANAASVQNILGRVEIQSVTGSGSTERATVGGAASERSEF